MTEYELLLALTQIENVIKLVAKNEYATYMVTRLTPIQVELRRQLTNLNLSSKIKE